MPRKFLLIFLVVALASCRRDAAPAPRVHGELIAPATNAPAVAMTGTVPEDLKSKKHPKPPSTQRRMVMTEVILSQQTNFDAGAMPSGTKGSAADLARTNLPSITRVPGWDPKVPGYTNISFSVLAGFDFILSKEMADGSASSEDIDAKAKAQIPAAIQSLDKTRVVIEGFLLPVKMNDGLAVEFLLMRNQSMCCYGVPPKITEWITVVMNGKGVKPVMDQPLAVAGVLHVGPIEENGCLAGLYRLDGDKVIASF